MSVFYVLSAFHVLTNFILTPYWLLNKNVIHTILPAVHKFCAVLIVTL